ncbi:MAG: class I SAM-dependent methyltransferase [Gammaproteobacteria bacterium]|nr:class I SAM-dependent methyltransferase [Gammaproteobacteria bacterium]
MSKRSFEQGWKDRFTRFGNQADDDAGIAGWSKTGLATRIRYFRSIWNRQSDQIRWLDAGCGAGTYSDVLQDSGLDVIALDYSLIAIKKGKQRYSSSISWGVADVTRLPLPDNSVDGCLCFGVTQAMSSSVPIIEELVRVARPGGQVLVDGLNSWCLPHLWERMRRCLFRLDPHLRYQSPSEMREIAKTAGLQDITLHWLTIMPSSLARFQWIPTSPLCKKLFQYLPFIAILFSHSMIIQGCIPAENRTTHQTQS